MAGKARTITLPGILDEYMGEEECAASLGLAPITLARWRIGKEGKGPPYTKVGKRVLYRRSSVKDWVVSQEKKPEHPKTVTAKRTKSAAASSVGAA